MKILGMETSCDETAAAVVEDGCRLLSNIVATQIDIHKAFGGVVPEVAARNHIEVMLPVIEGALEKANCDWGNIDAIAVTYGPGLSGSLLIGTLTARTLAYTKQKPLYAVDHMLGHVYANFLEPDLRPQTFDLETHAPGSRAWKAPSFPLLALIVSGGHTQLVLFEEHLKYRLLGETQDDAVGEAFDKVAKIIGLPYPGGPSVEEAAQEGDAEAYKFPKARLQNNYDFSFSGLKTAVLRKTQEITGNDFNFPSYKLSALLSEKQVRDVAASFQKAAVETLVDKTLLAYQEFSPASVIVGGGVAASPALRQALSERLPLSIEYAARELCTDNAAMIAAVAYYQAQQQSADDPFTLEIDPALTLANN